VKGVRYYQERVDVMLVEEMILIVAMSITCYLLLVMYVRFPQNGFG
jgi:hypothetical protein